MFILHIIHFYLCPIDTVLFLEEVQKINEENTEKSGPQEQEAVSSGESQQGSSSPASSRGLDEGEGGLSKENDKEDEEEQNGPMAAKDTQECKSDEDKQEEGRLEIPKADKEEHSASQTETPTLKDAIPAR